MQELLEQLVEKHRPKCREGEVPGYIPILREQNPLSLGITVIENNLFLLLLPGW